jgi:hypothetical protein
MSVVKNAARTYIAYRAAPIIVGFWIGAGMVLLTVIVAVVTGVWRFIYHALH